MHLVTWTWSASSSDNLLLRVIMKAGQTTEERAVAMSEISLGPVTDTEIKLTKEVLNAVVNATWTYRCSREFKRGQVESIRIAVEYFNAAAKVSYVGQLTSVMMSTLASSARMYQCYENEGIVTDDIKQQFNQMLEVQAKCLSSILEQFAK